jgi:2-methylcitrate dehydratase PrpD
MHRSQRLQTARSRTLSRWIVWCSRALAVHPGASLTSPGLAVAQEVGASGREFMTAVVAGGEVMHRIGDASKQSTEHIGFHAPGVTGAFGGAVVAGRLLKLDAGQMTNALGIAGSLASGLLEFSKSGGGMVKRLHLGRAAESGVLAASLAKNGFSGPATVLEGKFGYMNVFCHEGDPARLTAGLGEAWKLLTLTLKTLLVPCHLARTGDCGARAQGRSTKSSRRRRGHHQAKAARKCSATIIFSSRRT